LWLIIKTYNCIFGLGFILGFFIQKYPMQTLGNTHFVPLTCVIFTTIYTTCIVYTNPYNFKFYIILKCWLFLTKLFVQNFVWNLSPFHTNLTIFRPSKVKTLIALLVFATFWTTTLIVYNQNLTFQNHLNIFFFPNY
jgi:hypothetical protein